MLRTNKVNKVLLSVVDHKSPQWLVLKVILPTVVKVDKTTVVMVVSRSLTTVKDL